MISGTLCCTSISTLPPSWMSVPRPAMLVAMVTAPGRPAWATICASWSWKRALSTLCGMPAFFSASDSSSDFSIETVPTSIGCWRARHSPISLTMARVLSASVR
jgi:hypothetical protein